MGWLCAKCIKTTEEIILHRRDSYSKLEFKMELARDNVSKVNWSLVDMFWFPLQRVNAMGREVVKLSALL